MYDIQKLKNTKRFSDLTNVLKAIIPKDKKTNRSFLLRKKNSAVVYNNMLKGSVIPNNEF